MSVGCTCGRARQSSACVVVVFRDASVGLTHPARGAAAAQLRGRALSGGRRGRAAWCAPAMAAPCARDRRITVSCDPTAFPCFQAFENGGKLFWDISYLYDALRTGGERRTKADWVKWCRRIVCGFGLAAECVLRSPGSPDTMSTFALLTFLAATVDKSLTESVVSVCASILRNALARAIVAAERVGHVHVSEHLRLLPHGRVAGVPEVVDSLPPSLRPVLRKTWRAMLEAGDLTVRLDDDAHPLAEVLYFFLFFLRDRRTRGRRPLAAANASQVQSIKARVLQWCSACVDLYVLHEYASAHDTAAPAPALRMGGRGKRKYTRITVDTMWDVLQQARTAGVSAEQVARVRQCDAHFGCSEGATLSWQLKLNSLYQNRRSVLFHAGVHHINMVADPATHSKKETFVSVLWSWETGSAAYGDAQFLHPGKDLLPSEQDMPDAIALLARRRKLQRVASWRQLQAVSNVVRLATGGRLVLDSFKLPADAHVRAVRPGEVRVVRPGDSRDIAWLVNPEAGTFFQVLPDELEELPISKVQCDVAWCAI